MPKAANQQAYEWLTSQPLGTVCTARELSDRLKISWGAASGALAMFGQAGMCKRVRGRSANNRPENQWTYVQFVELKFPGPGRPNKEKANEGHVN